MDGDAVAVTPPAVHISQSQQDDLVTAVDSVQEDSHRVSLYLAAQRFLHSSVTSMVFIKILFLYDTTYWTCMHSIHAYSQLISITYCYE